MDRRSFLRMTTGAVAAASLARVMPVMAAVPYTAGRPLLLNQNENALGMSPRAIEAARKALALGHRYPDNHVYALAAKLAQREGLLPENVAVSNGSTGIIEAIARWQADKGATIVAPAITYGQAKEYAGNWGLDYRTVPMGEDFATDIAAMEAATLAIDGPVLVYLVNPNNPTGRLTPSTDVATWIGRAPKNVFFLVDEAYHELVADAGYRSAVSLVQSGHENLVVARTFSKVYAMAGMRVGYGMAHAEVMKHIRQHYADWNVSVTGVAAASAALDDGDFFKRSFDENQAAKRMLGETLAGMGLRCIPSEGNFVLHELGMDQQVYRRAMRERHVLIGRDMGTGKRWNRLSMGTVDEMAYFIEQFLLVHS